MDWSRSGLIDPDTGKALSPARPAYESHTYNSWDALRNASDAVVLGLAMAQQVDLSGRGDPRWTRTTIREEINVLRETNTQRIWHVRQPGGVTAEGIRCVAPAFPLLDIGDRYILFLKHLVADLFIPVGAPYIGGPHGVFTVDEHDSVNSFTPGCMQISVPVSNALLESVIQAIQA